MKFSSDLPYFCLFILSLWLSGTLFEELLRCRLIGELIIGLLFGNLSPGTLLPTDETLLILAGEVGVLGLVFEAGLGTDVRRVMKAGPRAALVAGVGVVVPLATGFGFMYGVSKLRHIWELGGSGVDFGKRHSSDVVIEAVASGASLASTSIAIAVTMMKQQGILDTAIGTLITTAAMLDDVVSLVLLGIVSSIGGSGSGIRPMTVVQPLLASFGIILVGVCGCAVVSRVKSRKAPSTDGDTEMADAQSVVERVGDTGVHPEKRPTNRHLVDFRTRISTFYTRFAYTMKLAGMLLAGLVYSILAEYLGSSRLLGAFVAGVFFSAFEDLCQMYEEQITDKVQPAMSAIFFATIGFAIPLSKILEPVLFGWGVVYAVIASLSKLVTVAVVPARVSSEDGGEESGNGGGRYSARWMVGATMIARGELGLLMVQQAQAQGVMSQTAMVITTWSIVLATLFGVGAFCFVMKQKSY
ncbi:MAG: Cation/H+ exchanger [Linnemannia elongata]|nr:MAG: Cation/H+ exchanger [Linnemannia elongata]